MLKTAKIAAVAASFALAGGATVTPTSIAFAQAIVAEWQCIDKMDSILNRSTPPIVRAWVLDDSLNGKIEANGIVKEALYYQSGLDHRRDFDPNYAKDTYDASFVIEPNGIGKYVYFGNEDTAKPSLITQCEKTK